MTTTDAHRAEFDRLYDSLLKHLQLQGLQPKTIEAYSRVIRRLGEYFGHCIQALTSHQLTEYFHDLLTTHSWSSLKLVRSPEGDNFQEVATNPVVDVVADALE